MRLKRKSRFQATKLQIRDAPDEPKPKRRPQPKKKAQPVKVTSKRIIPSSEAALEQYREFGILAHTTRTRPNKFLLYCDYDRKADAAAIPFARWSSKRRAWLLPISREALRHFMHYFPDFRATEKAYIVARDTWKEGKEELALLRRIRDIKEGRVDVSHIQNFGKLQPWDHQKIGVACIEEAWTAGYGFANNDEQGLGKTCTVLTALDRAARAAEEDGRDFWVVIFSPKSLLHSVWVKEITKFSGYLRPLVPTGSIPRRAKQVLDSGAYDWCEFQAIDGCERTVFVKRQGVPNIILLNHEVGSTRNRKTGGHNDLIRALIDRKPTHCIIDEYHKVSNKESQRGKALNDVRDASLYAHGMTGTPGLPENLYGQLYFLDRRIFPVNLGDFRKRYIRVAEINGQFSKIIGYQNLQELERRASHFSIRRTQEEIPDIPRSQAVRIEVEMSKEQDQAYDAICNQVAVFYKNHDLTKVSIGAQLHALRNITCGHVRSHETNEIVHFRTNPKLSKLLELLGDEGVLAHAGKMDVLRPDHTQVHKAVLACAYKEDVRMLSEALTKHDVKHVVITGDVVDTPKRKARTEAADSFVEDPTVKVLVGITTTFGVGLNLVPRLPSICDLMVFWSNDYDPKNRDQAEKRIQRSGQTKICRFVDIVCQDTIDESILSAINNKKDITAIITGDNLRRQLRGGR